MQDFTIEMEDFWSWKFFIDDCTMDTMYCSRKDQLEWERNEASTLDNHLLFWYDPCLGWGKTTHPGKASLVLQQTDLDIIDNGICNALNYANYRIPVTKSMVCAGLGANTVSVSMYCCIGGCLA